MENTAKVQFISVDENWLLGSFICVLVFGFLILFTLSAFIKTHRMGENCTLEEVRCFQICFTKTAKAEKRVFW